jgi:hypothetical protein
MTQSIMGHSGSPSGSVWWIQDQAVTISFIPLPVIGWSGMHHSGCRRTPITSFRPLPCRMRPAIHDGGQSFCMLCAQQRTSQNSVNRKFNFGECGLCELRRTPLWRSSRRRESPHRPGPIGPGAPEEDCSYRRVFCARTANVKLRAFL